jgi:transglutaminase-like putative cysteine protease
MPPGTQTRRIRLRSGEFLAPSWRGSHCFGRAHLNAPERGSPMLIEAGFDIAFECPAQTPMLLQLSVHPSRDADLLTPDKINCDPILATRSYIDHFGNRVTRVEVPAGFVVFSNRFVIHDSGQPEETPPDVDMTPIADLPDDVLLFLLQSRYCDSDKLADFAWSNFGMMSGGRQRVRRFAISCTRRSASAILMRAPPVAPAIPCMKGLVYAATSRISP